MWREIAERERVNKFKYKIYKNIKYKRYIFKNISVILLPIKCIKCNLVIAWQQHKNVAIIIYYLTPFSWVISGKTFITNHSKAESASVCTHQARASFSPSWAESDSTCQAVCSLLVFHKDKHFPTAPENRYSGKQNNKSSGALVRPGVTARSHQAPSYSGSRRVANTLH